MQTDELFLQQLVQPKPYLILLESNPFFKGLNSYSLKIWEEKQRSGTFIARRKMPSKHLE